MNSDDLKTILMEIGVTQADFARLIGVTPRAVALWMAGERAIPGPAVAYARLLRLLPPHLQQVELSRLKQKGTGSRNLDFQREVRTPMHKTKLVARLLESGKIVGGYVRQITLPVVPQLGMKFEQGISCRLWETQNGGELSPEIERVIYDLDEEEVVCLFTVTGKLASSFWQKLKVEELGEQCAELKYFRHA